MRLPSYAELRDDIARRAKRAQDVASAAELDRFIELAEARLKAEKQSGMGW